MPDDDARAVLAQRVRESLAAYGAVREKNMFGELSFMVDERLVVGAGRGGRLLVRTRPADHADLLLRGGEPARMGNGRPMGEGWLRVPASRLDDDAELAFWIRVGLDAASRTGSASAEAAS